MGEGAKSEVYHGTAPFFTKMMVLSMEVAGCKNFGGYAYAIYVLVFRDKNSAVSLDENSGHRPDARNFDSVTMTSLCLLFLDF